MEKVGILALQGAVREHASAVAELGVHPVEVRTPEDLSGVDAAFDRMREGRGGRTLLIP